MRVAPLDFRQEMIFTVQSIDFDIPEEVMEKSLVVAAGIESGAKIEHISLSLLEPDPHQPRETLNAETIAKLGNNIKAADGFIQPLLVRPHPRKPGRFMIIAGERRFHAAGSLGLATVPCIVKKKKQSDRDIYVLQVAENLNREDLNHIDTAKSLRKLRGFGLTLDEIHQLTGLSSLTISNTIELLGLDDEVQQMVRDRRLPKGSALKLAQYKKKHPDLIREIELANAIVAGDDEAVVLIMNQMRDTKRGAAMSARRTPETPVEMLKRVMDLGRRADSYRVAMDAFMRLPGDRQREILERIPAGNRIVLYERLRRFGETQQIFVEFLRRTVSEFIGPDKKKK